MSTHYRYQEKFAFDLTTKWLAGQHSEVRIIIRHLKNKAQAAFIAASVAVHLNIEDHRESQEFLAFIHPNQK